MKNKLKCSFDKKADFICRPGQDSKFNDFHYQPGYLFPDETISGLIELGDILRKIHNRMVSE